MPQLPIGPHIPHPGAGGHVQPSMMYPVGAPPNSGFPQALQLANSSQLPQPRTTGQIVQSSMSQELGRGLPGSAALQTVQVGSNPQLPRPSVSGLVQSPELANHFASTAMLRAIQSANITTSPYSSKFPWLEGQPNTPNLFGKNVASQPADGMPPPHLAANGGPVQSLAQATPPSVVNTSNRNVPPQHVDGILHPVGNNGAVQTPAQVIPPSVVDTFKDEASQPADGTSLPHPVGGGPAQAAAPVTPPSIVDASSKNETSQSADSTHSPHVSVNGKRPRSDSSIGNPFIRRKRLQQE